MYRSIAEDIFFALALTRAGGTFYIALETAEVIAPVMAAMDALSRVGGITGVAPPIALTFPSSGVVLIVGAMIQPSWSNKLELGLMNCRFEVY